MAAAPVAAEAATIAVPPEGPNDDDMWDEREPRRIGPIIAVLLGLALLIGVIVYALFFLQNDDGGGSGETLEVPNVVGQTYDAAAQQLDDLGFKVTRRDEFNDAQIDTVFDQRPEAGRLLEKGRTVILLVSARQVTVPNVVGKTFDEASAELTRLQLIPQRVDQMTADQPANTVLATSPAADTKADRGTPIQVTVAVEPPIAVPDVRGQEQTAAQAVLQAAGFQVAVSPVETNAQPQGTVVATDPAGGAMAPKGSTINMQVATPPKAIAIPNVVGQPAGTAGQTLQAAGFNVVITCASAAEPVKTQSPGAGEAPPGTTDQHRLLSRARARTQPALRPARPLVRGRRPPRSRLAAHA